VSDDGILDAKPFPLDVWALSKGDIISPEECERMAGVKRTHPRYSLRLCSICQLIQRKWSQEKGELVTLTQDHYGIRVCDDNSAVGVNTRVFTVGVRKVHKANRQTAGIDREKLTAEMKVEQERLAIRTGAFLAGGKKAMRVKLKAYERQTPLLTGGGSK